MESRDWEFPIDLRGVVTLIVKTCRIIKLQALVIMLKYAEGTLEHESLLIRYAKCQSVLLRTARN